MPTATKTYAFTANTNAVAAQVERDFQDLLDFLNITKLDAANLQDGAVTSVKLATDAVTQAKVANDAIGEEEITTALAQKLGVSETATTRRGFSSVVTSENTTSTTFTDLTTVGPQVTVDVQANGLVLVVAAVTMRANGGGDALVDLRMDGATLTNAGLLSTALSSFTTVYSGPGAIDGFSGFEGYAFPNLFPVAAGSHTFKLMYRRNGGTSADFQNRKLWVMSLAF